MTGRRACEYRFATFDDVGALKKLWTEETEWGEFPEWMIGGWSGTPGVVPRTVVAVDPETGAIVGQVGLVPTSIYCRGRILRGVRPHSTIVGTWLRESVKTWEPLEQPSFAMYKFGVEESARDGVQLAHMVPHPRWAQLSRIFPSMQAAKFPLLSIRYPLPADFTLPQRWSAEPLAGWGGEVDELWDAAAGQYACGLVRNSRTLQLKTALDGSKVIEVRRDRELMGIVVARKKGDRQWLISDMITRDTGEALRATIIAAVIAGEPRPNTQDDSADVPVKAAILATPLMEPTLQSCGFVRDAWTFPFVVQKLDESLDSSDIDPAGWYVAATD